VPGLGGCVVTVMPHGVLFRGGAERDIRNGLLDEDLLEAVIGLGPNLFYGTGIPACLLVLRAKGAKAKARRGKVLFINADREFYEGRAQNYLQPEHIEKIVRAYEAFEDIPAFARIVSRDELRENDDNLNIRRYADNAPPPEPHDVRSHLSGGVPKVEVAAKDALFAAHGLDPRRVLRNRDARTYDFVASLREKPNLKKTIEAEAGVLAREAAFTDGVATWWKAQQSAFSALPKHREVMKLRAKLLESFEAALLPIGLLDRFQVAGIIATWWGESQNDWKGIAARGYMGLVDAWVSGILAALEDEDSKENPREHKLVRKLMPKYVTELAELEAKKAELEAKLKSAEPSGEDDEAEEPEETLSEAEKKQIKADVAGIKKKLKALEGTFVKQLETARAGIDEDGARKLVLGLMREALDAIWVRYVATHRQEVIAAFESWWDKYRVTLANIEEERDAAAEKLRGFLKGLGYGL